MEENIETKDVKNYTIKLGTYFKNDTDNGVSTNTVPIKYKDELYIVAGVDIENYSNVNLSLEEISKNIFLTPAHICVIFKDHTNTTVNKYITEYRLDKAKKLLKDPSIKMNEIASRVGYRDGNYFAKTFKKETGYSPSEYRRKFV